jgi:glycine cleavage system aminomethyltransferase T
MTGRRDGRDAQHVPMLVQPLAAFDARRPLRAGYELFRGDEPVGYVTSGTSVPISASGPNGVYTMRPIGLALVRADIRFRPGSRVRFSVRDAGQVLMEADLVERNLPSPMPAA